MNKARPIIMIALILMLGAFGIAACTSTTSAPADAALPTGSPEELPTQTTAGTESALTPTLTQAQPEAAATEQATEEASTPMLLGDVGAGQALFNEGANGAPQCSTCHFTSRNSSRGFSVGPNLEGLAERAATRIEGLDASAYLYQSITDPSAYVVSGYNDIMYHDFASDYSPQQIADLIAYLLTL